MQSRAAHTPSCLAVLCALILSACGITTSQPGGLGDEIEQAAAATAELDAYEFSWVADYRLAESETGRSTLQVSGSGVIDAESGDVAAVVTYDEGLRSVAESLFPATEIGVIQAFTTVVDDEVYIRGFNAAALDSSAATEYDVWYRISERRQDLGDPFVRTDVLPADVLPVMTEPLADAGAPSVSVDRDFVLDLGTRFSRSLFDFGLRIGGGDFVLSVVLDEGLIRSVRLDGDDPEAGVTRYTFEITFEPVVGTEVSAPEGAIALP